MESNPLVSIISPCYNGAHYLQAFLESVLRQTYPKIELVFINDGSTDDTEATVLSYQRLIEEKGYRFLYISQPNKGQAAAINQGLKVITGDLLTWPDSDDWLTDNCIERKVELLEEHPEWDLLCCRTNAVSEADLNTVIHTYERKSKNAEHFFEDLILEKDVYFAPGGYMVRTKALMSALKDGQIYEGRGGQNWQLLLPVAYTRKCGFVDDVLYYYRVRVNSHSRAQKTPSDEIQRSFEHEAILTNTINRMKISEEEKEKYIELIKHKYLRKRRRIAFRSNDQSLMKASYKELNKNGKLDYSEKLECWKKMNYLVFLILRIMHLPIGLLRRIKQVL